MVPAYEGNKPYIFVSYAHKDSDIVLPIVEKLYDKQYRVWYDEGIAPGSEWPQNIADHLNNADAVLIFVSERSLASANCENEVKRAVEGDGLLIEYRLNEKEHPLLRNKNQSEDDRSLYFCVDDPESLISAIPESFIGDGSGYERKIVRKRYGAFGNIMVVFAAILTIALAVGLYGLNEGWFDAYLPGLNTETSVRTESQDIKQETEKAEALDNGLIARAVVAQTDKSELNEELTFTSDAEKNSIFYNLGFEELDHEPVYLDLTVSAAEYVNLEYASDKALEYMTYLPELKELSIFNGDFESLEILKECPKLETVKLRRNAFPIEIPENAGFKVVLME